ncbi:hypothetical protein AgCh_024716 [Apium graveolens]
MDKGEKVVEESDRVVVVVNHAGVNPSMRHRREVDQGGVDGVNEVAGGVNKTLMRRDEIVDMCKGRVGRLEAEINSLKEERKKLIVSHTKAERHVRGLANKNSALLKQVQEKEAVESSLATKVQELEGKLHEAEKDRDDEKAKHEGLERQVDGMNRAYKLIVEENEQLKMEVQKGWMIS